MVRGRNGLGFVSTFADVGPTTLDRAYALAILDRLKIKLITDLPGLGHSYCRYKSDAEGRTL